MDGFNPNVPPMPTPFPEPPSGNAASPLPFPAPAGPAPVSMAEPAGRPSREEMKAARARELQGVPFELRQEPKGTVLIKAQTFADRMLWLGVPSGLQAEISRIFNESRARSGNRNRTFEELMESSATDEAFANAICMAVFVEPRLVASEYELAQNPGAWVVEDVHISDRLRVLQWVTGTRDKEDLERVAEFQRRHSGMANPANR